MEIEMGVACRIHERIRNAYGSLVRSLKKEEYKEDFNLDGRIILKCFLKMDWIHFAQNRDK
jgi:hypothetical protein